MLLRGVFTATRRCIRHLVDGGPGLYFPEAWTRAISLVPPQNRDNMAGYYLQMMQGPDEVKRKKYALREHDIIYSSGLIWRQKTVVPFSRIQHVEVTEGPIDRLFDLSRLNIYTAGGSSSDLTIPGLMPSRAESIKHYILNRNSQLDEEE